MVGNELKNGSRTIVVPVKDGVIINEASLIALNAQGYASEASKTTGITVIGRSEKYVDNTHGENGSENITVKRGVFIWNNDAENPVEQKDMFKQCYVKDSNTVTMDSENNSAAGKVIGLENGYVQVETL